MFSTVDRIEKQEKMDTMDAKTDDDDIPTIMSWSRAIFRVLATALEHGWLQSNYIPGYNLLREMYEKYFEHKKVAIQYATALADILQFEGSNQIPEYELVEEAVRKSCETIACQATHL